MTIRGDARVTCTPSRYNDRRMKSETRFHIFLAFLALAGSFMVYLATSGYGAGLSTDGARYLSTAENIAGGLGVIDYLGLPLINWPPLYPILLAALNWLTGLDVFILGQWVNILAFGGIIWFGGIFFERSLPGNWAFAALASLVLATSLPLIEVSANIASDPIFMVCTLLFLLAAQDYLHTRSQKSWLQMAALAIVSSFLRYAGVALVISGALIMLVANLPMKQSSQRTWGLPRFPFTSFRVARNGWPAAAFVAAAGVPIGAWILFHNYRLTGSILGSHLPANPIGNFVAGLSKAFSWFVPETILRTAPPLLLAAALLVLLAVRSNRKRWRTWWRRVQVAAILPAAIFFAVYGAMLIFAISYPEHRVPGSQRIHIVILPALLVLATITAQEFLPKISKAKQLTWRNVTLAVFGLWLLFPLYRVQVYVRASMQNGDVSYYNLYNTRTLRESDIVQYIQSMNFDESEKVYSNNEGAAWFYLHRRIYRLPRYDAVTGQSLQNVMRDFDGWPAPDELATLIWFKRDLDYKELVPTPEQMQQFIRLTPIYTGRYGIVYLMDVD